MFPSEWAQMLADVDWEAVPVVIRKVSTTVSNPTADDCAIIFSGSIDSVKVTNALLTFTVSNDFGTFNVLAPRENMHANCRFNWGDDQCTMIRFLSPNYKTKTVGSGSTTANVKSSGLTEDTGTSGSYGTDLVAARPDASFTASSFDTAWAGVPVDWTIFPATPFNTAFSYFGFSSGSHSLGVGQQVKFNITGVPGDGSAMPGGLTANVYYYVVKTQYGYYQISATSGGTAILVSSTGNLVTATAQSGFGPEQVKSGNPGFWRLSPAAGDWGANIQGYWQLPDTMNGRRSPLLTPYIQIDFGTTPVSPKLWQLQGRSDSDREELPRLIFFYSNSSSDFSTGAVFEGYFEMPPGIGQLYDVLLPIASTARYWRICVRTRWSDTQRFSLFKQVSAYAGSRHYWQDGQITFAGNTTTAGLRNVSRAVRESYLGELICAPLPIAPVSGDTFIIERGCARTFNACAARGNWENFGGFDSMPFETVIR
ncbi:phage BR0599 family protein [Pedosphaera parvula]|uniref:Bacteriophage phiJL001 Gp84 C-terminal domain-containing protein n=1 Tax=Pedosphaera parvula (strain Ellin514) TaxID=320771 RepID=B9XDG0_PEDPL|nr:phage BR0599 family protein [Pedosphaera parvula]EEF62106.1 hypothetical protein Cflav_PD6381 [Pedosphaera parvula Ellin514]